MLGEWAADMERLIHLGEWSGKPDLQARTAVTPNENAAALSVPSVSLETLARRTLGAHEPAYGKKIPLLADPELHHKCFYVDPVHVRSANGGAKSVSAD